MQVSTSSVDVVLVVVAVVHRKERGQRLQQRCMIWKKLERSYQDNSSYLVEESFNFLSKMILKQEQEYSLTTGARAKWSFPRPRSQYPKGLGNVT